MESVNTATSSELGLESRESGRDLAELFVIKALDFSGRHSFNATALIQFGETAVRTEIRKGSVSKLDFLSTLPPLAAWDFSIKGEAAAWKEFWEAVPLPGNHDLFALVRNDRFKIEGNLAVLMAHLQFFKNLIAVGRGR